jgi:hypothetical protein
MPRCEYQVREIIKMLLRVDTESTSENRLNRWSAIEREDEGCFGRTLYWSSLRCLGCCSPDAYPSIMYREGGREGGR